jgi:hypothetical protein
VGFGAIIAIKKGLFYMPVDAALTAALTEIRVEQSLDRQTSFALRFQENYDNNKPSITEHELFSSPTELAIVVPDGPGSYQLKCLVRGQIEQVSFDIASGGIGSSFEARGQDVRTILDRAAAPELPPAPTSDLLIPLLITQIPDTIPAVDTGKIIYGEDGDKPALNHVGTALELIEWLAAQENQCVWLDYQVTNLLFGVSIITTFNVKPSPPRSTIPAPPFNPFADKHTFHVVSNGKKGGNVVNFRVSLDHERIKIVHASAMDQGNGQSSAVEATSADDKLNDGLGIDEIGSNQGPLGVPTADPERSIYLAGPGGPTERRQKAEAMATEASWFVEAEAMTSASLYKGVLEPHQMISVRSVGNEWAGQYQVSEVTHVINASEHWMNVKLRNNSRGKKTFL